MRTDLRYSWVLIALAVLPLVAACGTDDSVKYDSAVGLSVAQEYPEAIHSARAELIYWEAVTAVQARYAETGEYVDIDEEIKMVERSLELRPGCLEAL